ncbi:PD-(D/E)XK nuclease family protein [Candidatus Uabimicrobium amorphum]|uniref:PD-(D/E)XK endonuclease-like domain-containing protein n=1 Tax=Uabimicrobium amorphum TaxID=2596890 RepID=A0A5S9IST5_UABAM|nr:PD-(D/E)XK nuclease family protein [Candidatus Uabimicrobium amorphum]BBM87087.1 hypothetical protein UABAM_05490 [Candidatus Uabimicrobium amorphum]
MQLSMSELKQYIRCPRSYKLQEVDGVEMKYTCLSSLRVKVLSKAMYQIHCEDKKPCDYSKEHIATICKSLWLREINEANINPDELNAIIVQEKSATKKREAIPAITKADRILDNITTWIFEYSREEVDVEVLYNNVYFQTTIGDCQLVGWIDQIRCVNGELQLLIFNSSKQAPNTQFLDHDFSLRMYIHAIRHGSLFPTYPDLTNEVKLEGMPHVFVYYFPYLERCQRKNRKHKKGERKGNPLIEIKVDTQQLIDFEYEVAYTISGIESEYYPKMPRAIAGCSLCPYSDACKDVDRLFTDVSFNVEELEEREESSCK